MTNTWFKEWDGFTEGRWTKCINVRDFIQKNYTPYDGDSSFLAGPTEATKTLWSEVLDLMKKEREAGGVLDMDKGCFLTRFSRCRLHSQGSRKDRWSPDR